MPLFQGFCPVAGTICPSLAAAVVGPSRAPQGMKKGRRPRRRPRLKLSDKAGPDQCPVPGENALFPAQIAGFLAVSRAVPVYPVFLNYVVPVQSFVSPYLQLAPRWIKGTVRAEGGYLLTGVFLGSLLLSTPGQPNLIMLASALCLIISPNRVNASRLCQSRPVTGFIARRIHSLRVMAHTARMLVCPGGCPYCWYALFKEQRGISFGVPHCPPEKGCG